MLKWKTFTKDKYNKIHIGLADKDVPLVFIRDEGHMGCYYIYVNMNLFDFDWEIRPLYKAGKPKMKLLPVIRVYKKCSCSLEFKKGEDFKKWRNKNLEEVKTEAQKIIISIYETFKRRFEDAIKED